MGLLGIVVPVLPGLLLILGGVLLWAALEGGTTAWLIFAASLLVAVIGWVLQYTLPGKRMRDRGVSNSTLVIAVMVGIVGFFVVPVVGAIIGFLIGLRPAVNLAVVLSATGLAIVIYARFLEQMDAWASAVHPYAVFALIVAGVRLA